jgi:hypothetical protein
MAPLKFMYQKCVDKTTTSFNPKVPEKSGGFNKFMNNRDLIIEHRLLMVEKSYDKAYHEIVGSTD